MNWTSFLEYARASYYTLFITQLACLFVIAAYLFTPNREKASLLLLIIPGASFIQMLLVELITYRGILLKSQPQIEQNSIYAYLVIESSCCALYIRENIISYRARKLLFAGGFTFVLYIVAYWASHFKEKYLPQHIIIAEGFLVIIFSLYFFYELFSQKTDKGIFRIPAFWAVLGMLVFFSSVTPLFLFFYYLRNVNSQLKDSLYIINNLAYCFLFIMFAITIFRKRKHTDQKIQSLL
jgi:hypothetical protein